MFLLLLLIAIPLLVIIYFKTRPARCDVPGPRSYPIIGNALKFLFDDPVQVLYKETQEWGKIYKLILGSDLFVIITDPVDAEVILSSTKYNSKAVSYKFLSIWLKDGLITSDGDIWHRHRKLLTPTFHFKILESSIEIMRKNANILMEQLQSQDGSDDFNVKHFVEKCSLDVICETAMNVQINSQTQTNTAYLEAVKNLTEITVKRIFQLWLQPEIFYWISGYSGIFDKSLETVESLSKKVIMSERDALKNRHCSTAEVDQETLSTDKKSRTPFLESMLTKCNFTNDEVHDEVMSFMFAGHDTTTAGLSFCIYNLANHPDVQEKAYQEIKKVFVNDKECPSLQDLNNLRYLECVIKETLRMYPPVPMIGRKIHDTVDLPSGYKLPPGTEVNIFTYGMHHDADLFPEPEKFLPERFENEHKFFHPFAYIPFSAGPRNCIGQRFAMLELKIVLGTLLKTYRILPANDNKALTLAMGLILRSKEGIPIRLMRR